MPRDLALPKETVDAMIDYFSTECFRLERELIPNTPISEYAKEMILKECVKRADDLTFVKYGSRIRDIFVPRNES